MSFDVVETTLASAVADAATFAVSYPSGRDSGDYQGGRAHEAWSTTYGKLTALGGDISLSFGASSITVTNNSGVTLAAGTVILMQLDRIGADGDVLADTGKMVDGDLVIINLGAPDTADVNGVFEAVSQAAGAITLDGALLSGGAVVFDVPRNIVIDSGGADTSAITFTGTDVYGNVLVETITLNGTTAVAGKKAFKTITAAANAATISNGAFAGPGDVLGLPMFLPSTGLVLREMEDGVAPTAGTIVAGVATAATATSGDVRGTYDPNSACDGAKAFQLVVALGDKGNKGVAQYAG